MKHAVFNSDGFPTAFYSEDIHGNSIPHDAIPISNGQWLEFINNSGLCRWQDGEVVAYEPPVPSVDLYAYVAQKRWEVETGGITLNGMSVFTDDRSKSLILGARLAAESDSDFTTEWKGADGTFVPIDAPTIIAVSNAILEHVRKCFATEAAVIADIESGAITTVEEINNAFDNQ